MLRKSFVVIAAAGLMTGCSMMHVDVRVLDNNYRNAAPFLQVQATRDAVIARSIIASYSKDNVARWIRPKILASATTEQRARSALKPTTAPDANVVADLLTAEIVQKIDQICLPSIEKLRLALLAHTRAIQERDPKKRDNDFIIASAKLSNALAAWHAAKASIPQYFSPTTQSAGEDYVSITLPDIGNTIAMALDSLTSNNIMNDPFAGVVINAPADYWQGVYNDTFGFGTMGNTDIAIRMNSIGNFTIKGVRDDTGNVTKASFNGVQAAIQVAAAVYGVHLPSSTPVNSATAADSEQSQTTAGKGDGAAMGTTSDNAAGAGASSGSAPSNPSVAIKSKAAALTLMTIISSQYANFETNPTASTVAAGTQIVNTAYNNVKSDLGGQ